MVFKKIIKRSSISIILAKDFLLFHTIEYFWDLFSGCR